MVLSRIPLVCTRDGAKQTFQQVPKRGITRHPSNERKEAIMYIGGGALAVIIIIILLILLL